MVPPPRYVPMLASTGRLGGGERVIEPKLDGARLGVVLHDGRVQLRTRNGFDATRAYPEVAVAPAHLADRSLVLDGEVVAATSEGRVSFQRLQARMGVTDPSAALRAAVPVVMAVFDCLWADGVDLRPRPLRERRRALEDLGLAGGWQLVPRLDLPAGPELEVICAAAGLEGAVAKLQDAPYRPGRSRAWQKIKCRRRACFVIGGALSERRPGSRVGSLAVGGHDRHGRLRYVGQVGYGLGETTAQRLADVLEGLTVPDSPFVDDVRGPLRWVDPLVQIEVSFAEVTLAGTLRQPVLTGVLPEVCDGPVAFGDELEQAVRARGLRVRVGTGQRL